MISNIHDHKFLVHLPRGVTSTPTYFYFRDTSYFLRREIEEHTTIYIFFLLFYVQYTDELLVLTVPFL